jgi:hypothetical protein
MISVLMGWAFSQTPIGLREMTVQILKAGGLYFALVFGAGFVLGTIRTLLVVPRVGTRRAELMEMPIMLLVTVVRTVRTTRNGWYRTRPPALRGIRVHAPGSRLVNQTILRVPRSCFGSGLLRNAWAIRNHAAPRGERMSTARRKKG